MSNMTGIAKMLTVRKNSAARLNTNPLAELIPKVFSSEEAPDKVSLDLAKLKSLLEGIVTELAATHQQATQVETHLATKLMTIEK